MGGVMTATMCYLRSTAPAYLPALMGIKRAARPDSQPAFPANWQLAILQGMFV